MVFTLVSLAIAGDARSHREARLHPMVSALILAFALRWATFYAANQIDTKPVYIGILYAIPAVVSLLAIISLASHKRLSLLAAISDRTAALWGKLRQRFPNSAGPSTGGGA
jgi:lipopolysaccharide export system permease protein